MIVYDLVRKNHQFCFIKRNSNISGNTLMKPIISPASPKPGWRPPSIPEKRTWMTFLKDGRVDNPQLNKQIVESWGRCRALEVDPGVGAGRQFGSIRELESRSEKLIHLAKPLMDTLHHCLHHAEFVIVLVDSDGHVLRTLGHTNALNRAERLRFEPGANWSEKYVGTNAIGTALALGHPVQITGTEHYCEGHHLWTCSTAPIRDVNTGVAGFLDISGPRECAAPHLMALVMAAVHAIESLILLDDSEYWRNEISRYWSALLNSVSEGVITVNSQGIITSINEVAAKALRHHSSEIDGKHIDIMIESYERLQGLLKKEAAKSTGEAILLRMPGNDQTTFEATVVPVRAEGSDHKGFILTFSPNKKTHFHRKPSQGTSAKYRFADIVGKSKGILDAIEIGRRISAGSSNVLILGESGTGKELFAQGIHAASDRHSGPFVSINCGAIPRELIQSELFGYADGSFTGAKRGGSPGKFEIANGGTIFLDEIGEMKLEMQINLLRVLEEKSIMPVGGINEKAINVRIIAATNKDLFEEVSNGRFRADLYYRLNVVTIRIPPLRAREGDISILAKSFFQNISCRMGKGITNIDPAVMRAFESYDWPGNVRELVNAVEYALNIAPSGEILASHLPAHLRKKNPERLHTGESVVVPLSFAEKNAIEEALRFFHGNISKACLSLGIARNTLYEKIRKYNITLTKTA